MFNLLKRQRFECRELWNVLDTADPTTPWQSALAQATPEQQAHAARCEECQKRIEEFAATRDLLAPLPSQSGISRPWFNSRVMLAIVAREAELGRAINVWAIIPKLASRVAWASTLAILMAVTLFYQKPATSQLGTEPSPESLFDNAPSPTNHDDVLVSMVEQE
jgi:hypothetical protein